MISSKRRRHNGPDGGHAVDGPGTVDDLAETNQCDLGWIDNTQHTLHANFSWERALSGLDGLPGGGLNRSCRSTCA
jgi:hypothetical protein